ncbi:hypothetical protein PPAR_a0423 [Pseudoalteromonas paragorgicola KMM 3548]|nr:hypothetical protein [Pseudoalteromonas distincta KMM 3548]
MLYWCDAPLGSGRCCICTLRFVAIAIKLKFKLSILGL